MFHTSVRLTAVVGWNEVVAEGPVPKPKPGLGFDPNAGKDNEDEKLPSGEVSEPGVGFEPNGLVLKTFALGEVYALNKGASGCDKTA